jgi:hypothetical protein
MNFAIGSDALPDDDTSAPSTSASSGTAEPVEAEVVSSDPNDPWGKK